MKENNASVSNYVLGFLLSVVLTLLAYLIVAMPTGLAVQMTVPLLLGFAVLQLFVQLIFFLHLGLDSHSRLNLSFLIATIGIVLMVVVGSLWIMENLNYNMMPQQMEEYLMWKEGIHK